MLRRPVMASSTVIMAGVLDAMALVMREWHARNERPVLRPDHDTA